MSVLSVAMLSARIILIKNHLNTIGLGMPSKRWRLYNAFGVPSATMAVYMSIIRLKGHCKLYAKGNPARCFIDPGTHIQALTATEPHRATQHPPPLYTAAAATTLALV